MKIFFITYNSNDNDDGNDNLILQLQVSMWRQLNTKTLVSQFGMLVVKTKSGHCGDITIKTHKVNSSSLAQKPHCSHRHHSSQIARLCLFALLQAIDVPPDQTIL